MSLKAQEVLDEYSVSYSRESSDTLKLACPFHEDTHPSAVIFTTSNVFHCRVCDKSTNLFRYLQARLGKNVFFEVNQKFGEVVDRTVTSETIENAHAQIWKESSKQLLDALYRRKLTEADLRTYRIGVIKDRISIPIVNAAGFFVNIRLYKPGASDSKFLNFSSFGKPPRFFPIEQIQYDRIMLCGGEVKTIPAARILNSHDIGAICSTAGESSLPTNLRMQLAGKQVFICLDVDRAGLEAAIKHALALQNIADWVGIIELPLDVIKYPKGDINDFLANDGNLLELVEQTKRFEFKEELKYADEVEPSSLSLTEATNASKTGQRLKIKAIVSTMEVSPYSIPHEVTVNCDRGHTFCDLCPISKMLPDSQHLVIPPEHPSIIKMVGESDIVQNAACKEGLGIPKRCKRSSFEITSWYNIEEARISEALDLKKRTTDRSMQAAYCIGEHLQLNGCYEMTGRMFPHPKNQQATFLISNYSATENALDTYVCKSLDELKIFQPKKWSVDSIQEKIDDLYEDLENNVTYIYKRRDLHLMVDLAYHSPLWLEVNGKLEKGWAEVLIVGDTGVGKSWVSGNLMRHYALGELVECKNATAAGLLGGQESFNKRWFITWGKIPSNDRGLVLLEELKGMPANVFARLTETRSSGVAQITGIAKGDQRTPARTRIIANSNPRSDRNISDYNYGVDCLVELIGSREDLRRFDAAIIVERNEVPEIEFTRVRTPTLHTYTQGLCRELVLWSWTRDKAVFEDEAYLFNAAKPLYARFANDIPIVHTASMRFKLGRLSAALAARTFSEKDSNVFVRNAHVDYIVDFLLKIYSKSAFGYAQYSDATREAEMLINPDAVSNKICNDLEHPKEVIDHLLEADEIDIHFIQDLLGLDPDTGRKLLSFFIRYRALKRENKSYRKTRDFINLLKRLKKSGYNPDKETKDEF